MHNIEIELVPGVKLAAGVRYAGRCRPRRRWCPEIVPADDGMVTIYETERPDESATVNLRVLQEMVGVLTSDANGDVTIYGTTCPTESVTTNLGALRAILAGEVVPVPA